MLREYRPILKELEVAKDSHKVIRVLFILDIGLDTNQTVSYRVATYRMERHGCYRDAIPLTEPGDGESRLPLLELARKIKDDEAMFPVAAVVQWLSDLLVA